MPSMQDMVNGLPPSGLAFSSFCPLSVMFSEPYRSVDVPQKAEHSIAMCSQNIDLAP